MMTSPFETSRYVVAGNEEIPVCQGPEPPSETLGFISKPIESSQCAQLTPNGEVSIDDVDLASASSIERCQVDMDEAIIEHAYDLDSGASYKFGLDLWRHQFNSHDAFFGLVRTFGTYNIVPCVMNIESSTLNLGAFLLQMFFRMHSVIVGITGLFVLPLDDRIHVFFPAIDDDQVEIAKKSAMRCIPRSDSDNIKIMTLQNDVSDLSIKDFLNKPLFVSAFAPVVMQQTGLVYPWIHQLGVSDSVVRHKSPQNIYYVHDGPFDQRMFSHKMDPMQTCEAHTSDCDAEHAFDTGYDSETEAIEDFKIISGMIRTTRWFLSYMGLIHFERYAWVESDFGMSKFAKTTLVKIGKSWYPMLNRQPYPNVLEGMSIYRVLAAACYDFPELAPEELWCINRFEAFNILYMNSRACKEYYRFFRAYVHSKYITSLDGIARECDDEVFDRVKASTMRSSMNKWIPTILGMMVLFVMPVESKPVSEVGADQYGNKFVFLTMFFILIRAIVDLFKMRKQIKEVYNDMFDIESLVTDKKPSAYKKFTSESAVVTKKNTISGIDEMFMRSESYLTDTVDFVSSGIKNFLKAYERAILALLKSNLSIKEHLGVSDGFLDMMYQKLVIHCSLALMVRVTRNRPNINDYLVRVWRVLLSFDAGFLAMYAFGPSGIREFIDTSESAIAADEAAILRSEGLIDEVFRKVDSGFDVGKQFVHSDTGKAASVLFEKTLTDVFNLPGREIMSFFWKPDDCVSSVLTISMVVMRSFLIIRSGGNLSDVKDLILGHGKDDEFIACKGLADQIDSGMAVANGNDPQVMMIRFQTLAKRINHARRQDTTRNVSVLVAKELAVNEWIRRLVAKEIQGRPKMSPFVVTLFGEGGVGKSCAVDSLCDFVHQVYNSHMSTNILVNKGVWSAEDEYDSNLDSATSLIVMNDIGLVVPEKRAQPVLASLRRMCDSIIEPFVKADVESKGKCFNMAKFVIATTNASDGGTVCEATDLEAANRRLGLKIHMKLKDECRNALNKPDRSKMGNDPSCLPYHCLYDIYELEEAQGGRAVKRVIKANLNSTQAMMYIRDQLILHIDMHNKLSGKVKSDFCKSCNLPTVVCQCGTPVLPSEGAATYDTAYLITRMMAFHTLTSIAHRTGIKLYKSLIYVYLTSFITLFAFYNIYMYHSTMAVVYGTQDFQVEKRFFGVKHKVTISKEVSYDIKHPIYLYIAYFCIVANVFLLLAYGWCKSVFSEYAMFLSKQELFEYITRGMSNRVKFAWGKHRKLLAKMALSFSSAYLIKRMFDKWRSKIEVLASEMGFITVAERKELLGHENPWVVPRRAYPLNRNGKPGMTIEQLVQIVGKAIFKIEFKGDTKVIQSHCVILKSNVLLVPLHIVKAGLLLSEYVDVTQLHENNVIGASIKLGKHNVLRIPEKDLCLVCINKLGSRKDLLKYVPDSSASGEVQGIWVRFQDLEEPVCTPIAISVRDCPAFHGDQCDVPLEGYAYEAPTYNGACGSIIIVDSKKGPSIVGIHLAGNGCSGRAVSVTKDYMEQAVKTLMDECNTSIRATEKDKVYNYVKREESNDTPHFRNPVNFIPRLEGMDLRFYGDVGTDFTPQGQTIISPSVHIARKYFPVPQLVPRDVRRIEAYHELTLNGAAPSPPIDTDLVEMAFHDYFDEKRLDELIELRKKDNTLIFGRSYTIFEALNGIKGHKYRTSIKASTSAGHPYNKSKSKILLGEPGCWMLRQEDHDHFISMMDRIFSGEHSGMVFKCTPKDEAGPLEKQDKPRLFQAGNMLSLLAQICYLGPAIDFMTDNPEHFEIAIGVNPHDVSWHNVVAKAFTRFENGFEFDYSKYDQTQHPDIRAATAKFIARLAMKVSGYPLSCLPSFEALCAEFTFPLINIRGAAVELDNVMPSGTFTTAHGNCIYNSLVFRTSVFHKCGKLKFREHVALRSLGDDNGGSVSNRVKELGWNQKEFARFLTSINMTATTGTKGTIDEDFKNVHDISFLCRVGTYCPLRGCVVGKLLETSLFKALAVLGPTKSSRGDQQADIVRSIYLESLNHGLDYATKVWRNLIQYCNEICIGVPSELVDPTSFVYEYLGLPDLGYPRNPTLKEFISFNSEAKEITDTGSNSEENTELVTFTEINETVVSAEQNVFEISQAPMYGKLENYLDREYLLWEQTYFPGDTTTYQFMPFRNLLLHAVLGKRLDNISLMRSDIELRFVTSATSAHCGSMIATFYPLESFCNLQKEEDFPEKIRNVSMTSRQYLNIRFGTEEVETKMVIPYVFWNPYINPRSGGELQAIGSVHIYVIATPLHAMDVSSPVIVRAYGRLKNYSFSGSTLMPSEAFPNESVSNTASVLANMAGKASTLFESVYPPLAVPANVVGKVLGGISGAARYFGHSRPLNLNAHLAVPDPTGGLSSTNLNLAAKTLALDVDQGVTMSGLAGGTTAHETLAHDFLLTKKTLVGVYHVTGDMAPEDVVFRCGVTPAFSVRVGDNSILTPAGMVASQYNLWCGTMCYELIINRCSMFGGRFILYHEPRSNGLPAMETNKSILFDIRDTATVQTEVGWTSDKMMLRTNSTTLYAPLDEGHTEGFTNGVLTLVVHSPVTGTGLVPAKVTIELYAWAEADTVFCDHVNYLSNYTIMGLGDKGVPSYDNGRSLVPTYTVPPDYPVTTIRDNSLGRDPRRAEDSDYMPLQPPIVIPFNGVCLPICEEAKSPSDDDPVEPTIAPSVQQTTAPSRGESYWPSLFSRSDEPSLVFDESETPTVIGDRTLGPTGTLVEIPSGLDYTSVPTEAMPNQATLAPSQNGTMISSTVPSKAPTTFAPTFNARLCESVVNPVDPWCLGGGHVGFLDGNKVLYVRDATELVNYTYWDRYGNTRNQRGSIEFDGTLLVNGQQVSSPFTFTPPAVKNTLEKYNVTGSDAIITKYNMCIPADASVVYHDAEFLRPYFSGHTGVVPIDAMVETVDGTVLEAIQMTAGWKSYIRYTPPPSICGNIWWCSRIVEGQLLQAETFPIKSEPSSIVYNQSKSELEFSTGVGPLYVIGGYCIELLRSEGAEVVNSPTTFKVGVRPNTTEVLAMCAGERMNSLRSLLQIPEPVASIEVINNRASYKSDLYNQRFDYTNIIELVMLSHVGIRGGMVCHFKVLGEAAVSFYRPLAYDMPPQGLYSRGYEYLDTRVNPCASIKFPYYSQNYFFIPRSWYQPGSSSLTEKGVRVVKQSATVIINESVTVAEDFSAIQFLGCPLLTRVRPDIT